MDNLYLYSQQFFKHDKQQDQEIQDLKDHIRSQQKEIEMLKQVAANSS
jgi:cell division protein FtsL